MAPLSQSNVVKLSRSLEDGSKVYEGNIDYEWGIKNVTFGGYSLSLMLTAVIAYQADTAHPDPVQLACHFLRAVTPGPIFVTVRTIRRGKQFDNLFADVHQKGALMFTCQLIFGDLTPPTTKSEETDLTLPLLYTPICPIETHPSKSTLTVQHWAQNFQDRFRWAWDDFVAKQTDREVRDAEGLRLGAWIELKQETLTASTIPVFVDLTATPWRLLPDEVTGGEPDKWWAPSLSLTIEFKRKLPLGGSFASHTLGIFGQKRHMENGRWSDAVEIWSAPCDIGAQVEIDESWREKMVCVAVASQVALMVPGDRNNRHAKTSKL